MRFIRALDSFHTRTAGHAVFGVIELGLAYGFALWAIDNGNVWLYVVTLALFIGGLQNIVKLVGKFVHGKTR